MAKSLRHSGTVFIPILSPHDDEFSNPLGQSITILVTPIDAPKLAS